MKRINLKFKSLSFWFLSFVLCFNTSCNNQSNKCMNIHKAGKSINNKENKKVDIDSEYKKLIKKYKKEELINNKKLVSGYFRNKQYIVIDCIIEQVAKYLENWNYKLLSLFDKNFYNELSQEINSKTCIDLLKKEQISNPNKITKTYLNSESNKEILTKNPLCLFQFFSMVKNLEGIKMYSNNCISNVKHRKNFDFENSSFVYQIIFSFLRSLYEDKQYNIRDIGLIFINLISENDFFYFLCVEIYQFFTNFKIGSIRTLSDNIFLFSKFSAEYVESNSIEKFLKQYESVAKIFMTELKKDKYFGKSLILFLFAKYIQVINKKLPKLPTYVNDIKINILKKINSIQ